ncbi:MAG TPA: VanW family protein, partial [Pseudoxanthomonas sp.]|nr:VanW family protein [Pseudoxanthomonas sp.]
MTDDARASMVVVLRTDVPTRAQQWAFEAKASVFRWRRTLRDLLSAPRRQSRDEALWSAPVLAQFRSPLWPLDETALHLVAGKIQNLRVAAVILDGIEVPAGQTLSFWKQVGRARRRRGFVIGRELREGCLVPAIGGGLCQLSSALYDTAVRAGLEVVERHRHSRVVPGSLAESDRDATVFWNYLDLRLRASWPWRLEVRMDAHELHVAIRGIAPDGPIAVPLAPALRKTPPSGDCSNCDQTECYRHEGDLPFAVRRTWLIHDDWPEFRTYRDAEMRAGDRTLELGKRAGMRDRFSLFRAKALRRWWLWRGRPLPQARQGAQQLLARMVAGRLRFDDMHLVVPQSLLPDLWLAGDLNGRSFDVLMNALPMQEIQRRLDAAFARHPESSTLSDFRADRRLVQAEREALEQARLWITPHAEILRLAGVRGLALPWRLPQPQATPARTSGMTRVLLPASGLARKG